MLVCVPRSRVGRYSLAKAVVAFASLLTVDLDVETTFAVPNLMMKKLVNDALEHLANNLKGRAEHLSGGL